MMQARVTGLNTFMRNTELLKKFKDDDEFKEDIRQIGERMRSDMVVKINRKTGNLERSIVAKVFRSPGPSTAFVAINYRYGPHAHLVEHGHGGPQPAPPHPFFSPVVRAWSGSKITTAMRQAAGRALARMRFANK